MKCGVGVYTQRLAQALSRISECQVSVLTSKSALSNIDSIVDVHAVVEGWRIRHIWRIIQFIRKFRPDVVHIQYPTQAYYAGGVGVYCLPMVLRLLLVQVVQTWHEPLGLRSGAWLLILGLRRLISVRPHIREHPAARFGWLFRKVLKAKEFSWIPGASLLPVVRLTDDERSRRKAEFATASQWLIVFYGFVAPLKGLETLFDLVAKTPSRLILACDINEDDPYHLSLLRRLECLKIEDRVKVMGFLPDEQLAALIATADAVIFPFKEGAESWNTSVDGAVAQGVFVLTTTRGVCGYDKERHTFLARPGDVDLMIEAMRQYAGKTVQPTPADDKWDAIARAHMAIYRGLVIE